MRRHSTSGTCLRTLAPQSSRLDRSGYLLYSPYRIGENLLSIHTILYSDRLLEPYISERPLPVRASVNPTIDRSIEGLNTMTTVESKALPHPYYPLNAQIHGYAPNEASLLSILSTASVGAAALLGIIFTLTSRLRPTLKNADRLAILWFALCKSDSLVTYCFNSETTILDANCSVNPQRVRFTASSRVIL